MTCASSPIEGQAVNVFEYESGGEIRRSAIPLIVGCLVSVVTFMCLLFLLMQRDKNDGSKEKVQLIPKKG